MTEEIDMEFSLAALAEVNMDDVEEVRFEALPLGTYGFQVREPEATDGLESKKGDSMIRVTIPCEIVEVKAVVDPKVDREALIGKVHNENRFIIQSSAAQDLGRLKSFIKDIGGDASVGFLDMLAGLEGHTFYANVKHRTDKVDKSIKYTQLSIPKRSA